MVMWGSVVQVQTPGINRQEKKQDISKKTSRVELFNLFTRCTVKPLNFDGYLISLISLGLLIRRNQIATDPSRRNGHVGGMTPD